MPGYVLLGRLFHRLRGDEVLDRLSEHRVKQAGVAVPTRDRLLPALVCRVGAARFPTRENLGRLSEHRVERGMIGEHGFLLRDWGEVRDDLRAMQSPFGSHAW